MVQIRKSIPHPDFEEFIGKRCHITVGEKTYRNQIPYFVGQNGVGHKVITTAKTRWVLQVSDWDRVKITLADDGGNLGNN